MAEAAPLTTPGHQARSPDRLHDLLLRIGDLSLAEIEARTEEPGARSQEPEGRERHEEEGAMNRAPTTDELVGARFIAPSGCGAPRWLAELEAERRVIRLHLGGEERFAAAEDAGRFRDAFGAPPPPGLPAAFLEPVPTALRDIVARYARTHAPFRSADIARRYGTGEAPILAALGTLVERGRVLWIRSGGPRRR